MDTVKLEPNMEGKCPQCGTPLAPDALGGLCPACLLKAGVAEDTVTDAKQPPFQPPTVTELAPLFPQLEILELIGKGGMGAVYKARQKQLDRFVALKILPPGIGDDPAFAERFAREAKALAKLNHPGIVTLYEFGEASAQFYFLMEFVDGVNLRQLLQHGRISPREALAIVPQICDALQFAHDQGIVHRDIKPENILMDRRGRVKVADFGLAKIVGADSPFGIPPSGGSSAGDADRLKAGLQTSSLTDAGKIMGTPQYMSPEQIQAPGEVDHRADIYALGVVFYQMLTGELPGKRLEPPSKKVQIDVRLDEVVLRALEKNPELRYQQVSALKTQVETIATSSGRESAHTETPGTPPLISSVTPPQGRSTGRVIAIVCASIFGLGLLVLGIPLLLWVGFAPRAMPAGVQPAGMISFFKLMLFAGLALLLVAAPVAGLIVFLRRKNTSGASKALAIGCGVLAAGALVVGLLIAGLFFSARHTAVMRQAEMTTRQQGELADARARAEAQMAEAKASAEAAMAAAKAEAERLQAQAMKRVNLTFGPVMERVIQARQTGANAFLDLDTGQLLMPSSEITNGFVPVQTVGDVDQFWRGLDIMPNTAPAKYLTWLHESGTDLMYDDQERTVVFEGVWAVAHGTNSAGWDSWDGLTPPMVRIALDEIEKATRTSQSGSTTVGKVNGPTYTSAKRLHSRFSGPAVCELTREQSSMWFFKTRGGGMGILQITGFTDNPRGVKIRYKLVQSPATTPSLPRGYEPGQPAPLPPAYKPAQNQARPIMVVATVTNTIAIAADGALTLAGDPCSLVELKARLTALEAKQPVTIAFQPDRFAPFKQVVAVMDACKAAGVELVSAKVPDAPAADAAAVTADLKARLSAAEKIMSFTERDEALALVARDAAQAGDAAPARQALGKMMAFTARDKAALEVARALLKTGRRTEAIEIARTITSFTQRDAALKELAQ